jgi:hypothetical protein
VIRVKKRKTNALKLKEIAEKSVSKGGSCLKNFKSFIEQIKHEGSSKVLTVDCRIVSKSFKVCP